MQGRRMRGILFLLLFSMIAPLQAVAAPEFRIDMDAGTAGYQDSVTVNAGDTFTTNIELLLGDLDSLSSFGFSVWWDTGALNTPSDGDITTFALADGWADLRYSVINAPFIYNFSQIDLDNTQGPVASVIASINWTALSPVSAGSSYIDLGFSSAFDAAFDGNADPVTPVFTRGTVNTTGEVPVVPEPVSSLLFAAGGAVLAARRYRKK